jgi:hypothetical protein
MKKYLIWSIVAIFTIAFGFVTTATAEDITWTDFSSWTAYDLGPDDVPLCDDKTVTITIVIDDQTTNFVQTDGTTVGYPFFLDEHSVFANVNDIDYPRFRTRAASAEGNFDNAAPNEYTMTWDFSPPLDHTNFFVVGQLLHKNVATITAYAPDTSNVTTDLAFEQLRAVKSTYTFYQPLIWTSATGELKKDGISGSNSKYGFFSIPYGTKVEQIVIALVDDGTRGSLADEVNYGIGCVLPIDVDIDIKPGSYPNCFNNDGNGVIPVAILGSADFDVSLIDQSSLSFEGLAVRVKGNGAEQCSIKDVSGDFSGTLEGEPDGFDDLVCQFVDQDGKWDAGSGHATVGGMIDGTEFEGQDEICITQ